MNENKILNGLGIHPGSKINMTILGSDIFATYHDVVYITILNSGNHMVLFNDQSIGFIKTEYMGIKLLNKNHKRFRRINPQRMSIREITDQTLKLSGIKIGDMVDIAYHDSEFLMFINYTSGILMGYMATENKKNISFLIKKDDGEILIFSAENVAISKHKKPEKKQSGPPKLRIVK
jgi:hypothetical protein